MDAIVPRHDPATLNCKVEGSPAPSVEWYKDGKAIKVEPGSHKIILPAGGLFFLKVSELFTENKLVNCQTVLFNNTDKYSKGM